ncbi:TERF1-interacting nuclear factor 2 isoform X2 [Syngnathoides biaculeatus]|uniref:TERF1-interacting nuclear factor 2 isoform X2 n=1 Tax=Syngnathoides biaculeatus TaxID=300417 RepID=UPI002ADDA56D|nr:TERF1-interacting nuclear factor 2 isoform X2 [Syngnathoides biaculeatus]
MATRKLKDVFADVSLPFAALRKLAPPMRLLSAAFWKVMQQRDVAQYGVLEEFVSSACENVPGLIAFRHQVKLTLGLRSRLILELLRTPQPDASVIKTHLKRICNPSIPSTSSSPTVQLDMKVEKSVENFHKMVHKILTDPAAKEEYFQGEFLQDYGPHFDQALEKLLWEFLIRLDRLLPVPSLSQTVSWMSETPAVVEGCALADSQHQLLRILLDHQTCLGHLDPTASIPTNMGDSVLASLSLPPSGKASSNPQQDSNTSSSGDQPARRLEKTPADRPINDDAPAEQQSKQDGEWLTRSPVRSHHTKRKRADDDDDDDEETSTSKSARALAAACLRRRARVVIRKLPCSELPRTRRTSSGPSVEVCSLDDKENCPTGESVGAPSLSSSLRRSSKGPPALRGDDYVADSEDEGTKNFKERLFMKRYCKTKHGTYFPTLREFWNFAKPLRGKR